MAPNPQSAALQKVWFKMLMGRGNFSYFLHELTNNNFFFHDLGYKITN